MLLGLAVADAAVCGQISALQPLRQSAIDRWEKNQAENRAEPWSPLDPNSTHWGAALVQVANQVTLSPAITDPKHRPDLGPNPSETAIALIHLPILLRYLDMPAEQYWRATQQYGFSKHEESLSTQLYQLLRIVLKPQPHQPWLTRLTQLKAELDRRSQAQGNTPLTLALKHTLMAEGDFRLAIASSLATAPSPFLPVLIGLLCTALRGLKTIPVKWRQALALPVAHPATTSYWQHWGLANEEDLRAVATTLWRNWAGL